MPSVTKKEKRRISVMALTVVSYSTDKRVGPPRIQTIKADATAVMQHSKKSLIWTLAQISDSDASTVYEARLLIPG